MNAAAGRTRRRKRSSAGCGGVAAAPRDQGRTQRDRAGPQFQNRPESSPTAGLPMVDDGVDQHLIVRRAAEAPGLAADGAATITAAMARVQTIACRRIAGGAGGRGRLRTAVRGC